MSNHSEKMFCQDGNQYFISNDQGRSWHRLLPGTATIAEVTIGNGGSLGGSKEISINNFNYYPLRSCNNIKSKNPLQDDIHKRKELDKIFDEIRIAVANLGIRLRWDRHIRQIYHNRIAAMRDAYVQKVNLGVMTLDQAYVEAGIARNRIMNEVRKITHSISYFQAKKQKVDGTGIQTLLNKYVKENVKIPSHLSPDQKKDFISEQVKAMQEQLSPKEQLEMYEALTFDEKNKVKQQVLESSGRPQEAVMEALKNHKIFDPKTQKIKAIGTLNAIGKYTLYVSLLVSLYNIITADDKIAATEHELMGYGAGAVGMYAGGFVGGFY